MSLRARVALLILALFIAGSLAALVRSLDEARKEVRGEITSIRRLTSQLLTIALDDSGRITNESGMMTPEFLASLVDLDRARHFDVEILSATRSYPQFEQHAPSELDAPGWFVDVLGINDEELAVDFPQLNGDTIRIRTDPTDEIAEIWLSTRDTYLSRFGALLFFNLIIYVMLGRWLQPIEHIIGGLDDIVKGDFGRRIASSGLPELDQIADKINHLTAVLGSSRADNERLQVEAINAQEMERLSLAQELHDSLGQTLSAIKAMAVSIGLRTQTQEPLIADSARQIERIADTAYGSVRNLMAWLRPVVLDELGLAFGLQQMVDDWNVHHENTFCRLSLETSVHDLTPDQAINVYRIVQEALTNVAKHAQASEVSVQLSGLEVLSLIIVDDGQGFQPDAVIKGMGLRGIHDRVNVLQGSLEVHSRPQQGVRIQVEFPRHPPTPRRRRHDRQAA